MARIQILRMLRSISLVVVTFAYAKCIEQSESLSVFGYNKKVAIPLGIKIWKQEELHNQYFLGRIAGGSSSTQEQFPYQAGVLTQFIGISGIGVCGGSLVSANRVVHAAHCWYDGENQGYTSEIVLGSVTLFTGGSRQSTRKIVVHPEWDPNLVRNDVAVIYLLASVQFSSAIAPIALPSISQFNETYVDEIAVASGYGRTGDSDTGEVTEQQTLSHANLTVITNEACGKFFPNNVVDSNICTRGINGTNTCSGDSGSPLAVTRNGQPLLIGITSFGSYWGCELDLPAGYSRVSSFMAFFNEHL